MHERPTISVQRSTLTFEYIAMIAYCASSCCAHAPTRVASGLVCRRARDIETEDFLQFFHHVVFEPNALIAAAAVFVDGFYIIVAHHQVEPVDTKVPSLLGRSKKHTKSARKGTKKTEEGTAMWVELNTHKLPAGIRSTTPIILCSLHSFPLLKEKQTTAATHNRPRR